MDMVYRGAESVIVWLGTEADESTLAMETMSLIGKHMIFEKHTNSVKIIAPNSRLSELRNDHQKLIQEQQRWIACQSLLTRPWFSRLWIYQEINLASDAFLTLGNYTLPWEDFVTTFQWIRSQALPGSPMSKFLNLKLLEQINNLFSPNSRLYADMLEDTKESYCSDPRDRVYALLGISSNNMGIIPDYEKTTEEVYTDLMCRNIRHRKSLVLLRYCQIRSPHSRLRELPSWVPDFSVPNGSRPITHCEASGRSAAETHYNKANGSLLIRGLHSATVIALTKPISTNASLTEIIVHCTTWEPSNMSTSHYSHYHRIEPMFDAFVSTLLCGEIDEILPLGLVPLTLETCKQAYRDCVEHKQMEDSTVRYIEKVVARVTGRAFFKTDNGFMGLCPADTRVGDHVVVALGNTTPLLLRPSKRNSAYKVVGGCYVHGMMGGEVILGALPVSWKSSMAIIEGAMSKVYKHGERITQQDPRLGSMPSGWVTRYGRYRRDGNDYTDELDQHGHLRYMQFKHLQSEEWTRFDPRLTSHALASRNVGIKDFLLV